MGAGSPDRLWPGTLDRNHIRRLADLGFDTLRYVPACTSSMLSRT